MKILLIDNYDSFLYNLKYELEAIGSQVNVFRNDVQYELLIKEIEHHDAIVLSPGPGKPSEAGFCQRIVLDFYEKKPILGICLGHQVIVESFGGLVSKAKDVMHGKVSDITFVDTLLFKGLTKKLSIARYHSLAASFLPDALHVDAKTDDGEIMAVSHHHFPVFGLQFHPESIMSKSGSKILENFIKICEHKLQGVSNVAVA